MEEVSSFWSDATALIEWLMIFLLAKSCDTRLPAALIIIVPEAVG